MAASGAAFTAATGGTITTDGDFKVHTFNSSGTFQVTAVGAPGIVTGKHRIRS